MEHVQYANETYTIMPRPRVDKLLEKGLGFPLLCVEAAPGYGKTESVAQYLQSRQIPHIWMRLTRLDNHEPVFWKTFLVALQGEYPSLAESVRQQGVPCDDRQLARFLQMLGEEMQDRERTVWVVDDYSLIQNDCVHSFFEHIVEAQIPNLCLAVISSLPTNLELVCLKANIARFLITLDDLRFTDEETQALFHAHGVSLPTRLLRGLDGWPLAFRLALPRIKAGQEPVNGLEQLDLTVAFELFDREYYREYPERVRRLLVKLSLVDSFNYVMAQQMEDYDLQETIRLLSKNPFIRYQPKSNARVFQTMYREFLSQLQPWVTAEEKRRTFMAQADMQKKANRPAKALHYYILCRDYDSAVEMMRAVINIYTGKMVLDYLLEQIKLLPQEYVEGHPVVTLLMAEEHVNLLKIRAAEELLNRLEDKLKNSFEKEDLELLGEVYRLRAGIALLRNQESFYPYFMAARAYLPLGSSIHKRNQLILGGGSPLMLADNRPGALRRMEMLFSAAAPYMYHVLNGSGRGLDYLFAAEAAYATLDVTTAKEKALAAVYAAIENEQHDIVVRARFVLAKVAVYNGSIEEMVCQIKLVEEYINERKVASLYDLRDRYISWMHLIMEEPDGVTPWLLEEKLREGAPMDLIQNETIQTFYLYVTERYEELLPILEHYSMMEFTRGAWLSRLHLQIFKAICHMKLKQMEPAFDALRAAYDMTHENDILAPFVERGSSMRALAFAAGEAKVMGIDARWLHTIQSKSSSFAKKVVTALRLYREKTDAQQVSGNLQLSRRKLEILQSLAQGLTQEEIAAMHEISINTVKSHIKGIYDTLGAVNRADAIRISKENGLL